MGTAFAASIITTLIAGVLLLRLLLLDLAAFLFPNYSSSE